jgi:hypothetical protein
MNATSKAKANNPNATTVTPTPAPQVVSNPEPVEVVKKKKTWKKKAVSYGPPPPAFSVSPGIVRAFRTADTVNVEVTGEEALVTFVRRERVAARKNDPWASGETTTVERNFSINVPAVVVNLGGTPSTATLTFRSCSMLPDLFASAVFAAVTKRQAIRFRVQRGALTIDTAEGLDAMFLDQVRKNGRVVGGFVGIAMASPASRR